MRIAASCGGQRGVIDGPWRRVGLSHVPRARLALVNPGPWRRAWFYKWLAPCLDFTVAFIAPPPRFSSMYCWRSKGQVRKGVPTLLL